MKFVYQYRTSGNVRCEGTLSAPDREAAYRLLRERGIKPVRVDDAPGVLNKVIGKGKRWVLIAVLVVSLGIVSVWSFAYVEKTEERLTHEDRQQLYGDATVVSSMRADGWAATFADPGDRHLAKHAIPGVACGCVIDAATRSNLVVALNRCRTTPCVIASDDLAEVALVKRIVNGMKDELSCYIRDGGNADGYIDRLELRQRTEVGLCESVKREIAGRPDDEELWKSRNKMLRARGLPMLPAPDEKSSKPH